MQCLEYVLATFDLDVKTPKRPLNAHMGQDHYLGHPVDRYYVKFWQNQERAVCHLSVLPGID